ncbi:hypothetical protein N7481_008078 [Penicillium waksmanii]|uniref:uncharacterized protein n=1 Tax=Penicillium waksmanii TaxID=69791 RepID=UPI0025470453|nr:uncharacterized protein N7481_008078 [Penicillium waksmanii]KAJ5980780.1 hypothetical protein N7481_008078 [Penicillium waksmanii]
MTRFGFLSLALLSLQAFVGTGFAADAETVAETEVANLAVTAEASFPASEIFGVKLINGRPTEALISVTNDEANPVTVNFLGGSLWNLEEDSKVVRNLTATRYGVEIPAGSKETIPYSFATEMHPQDIRLNIAAILSDSEGKFFTVQAFNGTVSVVEPETSIFDPQIIFLYFFLLACFGGTVYFTYNVWVAPYFPRSARVARLARSVPLAARSVPRPPVVEETPNPAVASATTYNADWIPSHHINRPEARKVKGSKKPRV